MVFVLLVLITYEDDQKCEMGYCMALALAFLFDFNGGFLLFYYYVRRGNSRSDFDMAMRVQ